MKDDEVEHRVIYARGELENMKQNDVEFQLADALQAKLESVIGCIIYIIALGVLLAAFLQDVLAGG